MSAPRRKALELGGCGALLLGLARVVLMLPGLCMLLLMGKGLAGGASVTPILGLALFLFAVAAVGSGCSVTRSVRSIRTDRHEPRRIALIVWAVWRR